jgi:hypothetical protein
MGQIKKKRTITNLTSQNLGEVFDCCHLILRKGHNSTTNRILKVLTVY